MIVSEIDKIRPKRLDLFVGQESIKTQIQIALASSKSRSMAFPHTIMAGPPGLGKTTIADIISEEMGVPVFKALSSAICDDQTLDSLLAKLPSSGYDIKTGEITDPSKHTCGIIFLDEIHQMKKGITERFHTILEDFRVTLNKKNAYTGRMESGLYWVPQFTLIGATNYLGNIPKPFVDRFGISLTFEIYTSEQLSEIISRCSQNTGIEIEQSAIDDIAKKSRGVPRIAIKHLHSCRDLSIAYEQFNGKITKECADESFRIQEIDNIGLTKLDKKVLGYLYDADRAVGINSISQGVDEDRKTIENMVEPWLVQLRLISKTPQGRMITPKGIIHLGHKINNNASPTLRRVSS